MGRYNDIVSRWAFKILEINWGLRAANVTSVSCQIAESELYTWELMAVLISGFYISISKGL